MHIEITSCIVKKKALLQGGEMENQACSCTHHLQIFVQVRGAGKSFKNKVLPYMLYFLTEKEMHLAVMF